jgi:hypothetical protein
MDAMLDPLDRFTTSELTSPQAIVDLGQDGWIYRGQSVASWLPATSLERCCARHGVRAPKASIVEWDLHREFRRAYHQYTQHVPPTNAVVEWLALMQHYGAPTRLLDFTYSVYIAAYFATEHSVGASAIWAVNTQWANELAMANLISAGNDPQDVRRLQEPFVEGTEAVFERLVMREPLACCVVPINPFRLNERLRTQKGIFLAPCNVDASFMDNLSAMAGHKLQDNVVRYVIPASIAEDMRAFLSEMGLSRRSLFPGLDGYAQSLGVYHPIFNPTDPHRHRLEAHWLSIARSTAV